MEVLAATKYVALEDMPLLAEGGVRLVGENRAQDLRAKVEAHGDLFEWDFIGQLQSRRVRQIAPLVRTIHSVASESAMQRARAPPRAGPAGAEADDRGGPRGRVRRRRGWHPPSWTP